MWKWITNTRPSAYWMIHLKRYFEQYFIEIYLIFIFFPTAVGVNVIQSGSMTAILQANKWRHIGYVKISSNSHQNAAAIEHTEFWVSLQVPFPLQLADTADVPAFHSVPYALLWPVSKQKRLQLFSFSMCSYIIVRPASVTPPFVTKEILFLVEMPVFFHVF